MAGYSDRISFGRRGRGGTGRADNWRRTRADMPVGEGLIVERVDDAVGVARWSDPDLRRRRRGAGGGGWHLTADRLAATAFAFH